MFQDLLFFLHQEGPKNHNQLFSLSSQGWNSLPGACSDLDKDGSELPFLKSIDRLVLALLKYIDGSLLAFLR